MASTRDSGTLLIYTFRTAGALRKASSPKMPTPCLNAKSAPVCSAQYSGYNDVIRSLTQLTHARNSLTTPHCEPEPEPEPARARERERERQQTRAPVLDNIRPISVVNLSDLECFCWCASVAPHRTDRSVCVCARELGRHSGRAAWDYGVIHVYISVWRRRSTTTTSTQHAWGALVVLK